MFGEREEKLAWQAGKPIENIVLCFVLFFCIASINTTRDSKQFQESLYFPTNQNAHRTSADLCIILCCKRSETLGLSDWSQTIVFCAGQLVLKSFKDFSSYVEFKEKINLDHIMH